MLPAQCIAVDIGTFCACDCKRLVSATPKTRIFACYPHRCIEGRSCKGHRGEKRELVPQQRELVIASVALDPCPPELGLRRFSTCQLDAENGELCRMSVGDSLSDSTRTAPATTFR